MFPMPTEFSKETIEGLKELGKVLEGIHDRLVSEGWVIENGEFHPPQPKQTEEPLSR